MPVHLNWPDPAHAEIVISAEERLNAVDVQTIGELGDLLDRAARRADVRCLVVRGEGRAFCAGVEADELAGLLDADEETCARTLRVGWDVIRKLVRAPFPTIAAVRGPSVGFGACLALACDSVVASVDARFGLVYTRLGLPASDTLATWLVARRVGVRKAWQLLGPGSTVTAGDAASMGLIDQVCHPDELERLVGELTASWRAAVPGAVTTTKKELLELEGAFAQLDELVERQIPRVVGAVDSAAFREGVAALRQRTAAGRG